jgi:hypothetical protein
MTLCTAWIREVDGDEELVFATDSTLTGGEKWNHGVKLFELPRADCLICFAGATDRAYPLLLNLIAILKQNERLKSPQFSLEELLGEIVDIFTELVDSIFQEVIGKLTVPVGAEAKFLFGGWNWKKGKYQVWTVTFNPSINGFIHTEEMQAQAGKIVFIGDPDPETTTQANELFSNRLYELKKYNGKLDMEPFHVLLNLIRNREERYVDGPIQLAKVYKSGSIEFFGIMWPSSNGKHNFLSKSYEEYDRPNVRYIDPDNENILTEPLPEWNHLLLSLVKEEDKEFIIDCYQDNGEIKLDLTDFKKRRLLSLARSSAYHKFIDDSKYQNQENREGEAND